MIYCHLNKSEREGNCVSSFPCLFVLCRATSCKKFPQRLNTSSFLRLLVYFVDSACMFVYVISLFLFFFFSLSLSFVAYPFYLALITRARLHNSAVFSCSWLLRGLKLSPRLIPVMNQRRVLQTSGSHTTAGESH